MTLSFYLVGPNRCVLFTISCFKSEMWFMEVIKACMPAQRKVIKAFILLWIKAEIIFMVEKS